MQKKKQSRSDNILRWNEIDLERWIENMGLGQVNELHKTRY